MPVNNNYFRIDWVLRKELAIGPAPRNSTHLEHIKKAGISSILSLCSTDEAPPVESMEKLFHCKRLILPDHTYQRTLELNELNNALDILFELKSNGSVFVHCLAAVERSPIVCMAWLVKYKELKPQQALDYLMESHPGTCPMPSQLKLLQNFS